VLTHVPCNPEIWPHRPHCWDAGVQYVANGQSFEILRIYHVAQRRAGRFLKRSNSEPGYGDGH
jgi:hypothetical protein